MAKMAACPKWPNGSNLLLLIIGTTCVSLLLPTRVGAESPPRPMTTSSSRPGTTVRLVNKTTTANYMYGGLEVALGENARWMSVCDIYLTQAEGRVACRMLGYKKAEVVSGHAHPGSARRPYPNHWSCGGTESSLDECVLSATDVSPCNNGTETASLLCYNDAKDAIEMRVMHGETTPNSVRGRLEVRLPFLEWGSVCDDLLNAAFAKAACNYMGYEFGEEDWYYLYFHEDYYNNYFHHDREHKGNMYGHPQYYYYDYYDYSDYWDYWEDWTDDRKVEYTNLEVLLDEVNCQPGQSFFECAHDAWGEHDCTSGYEDVWLYCTNKTVRLMSAIQVDHHVGSVELYVENEGWFEVCDVKWDDVDAQVVCKELGYVDGKALCCNSLGASVYGSISFAGSVTKVKCNGDETGLDACRRKETSFCPYRDGVIQLAATICYNTTVDQIDMSLAVHLDSNPHGSQDAGLLQLTYMGVKGIVCDSKGTFLEEESSVACRMLGKDYIGGKRLSNYTAKGGVHHTWLRDVDCTGNETSLDNCTRSAWGAPGEFHCSAPVHVICYKKELKLTLLRHAGDTRRQGIVQIVKDGVTGSVCADSWTDQEAHSACSTMGYNGGQAWKPSPSDLPAGYSKLAVLSGVACKRNMDFFKCENHGWGVPTHDCQNNLIPAAVKCFGFLKLEPRVGSAGIVKVFVNDAWQTICSKGFNLVTARVACRHLGFTNGSLLASGSFGYRDTESLRAYVKCNGTETSLLDCEFDYSLEDCGFYSDYAAISCYNTTSEIPDGTISLQDGYENINGASGFLQIQVNNTNMYFCSNFLAEAEINVLCREYGQRKGYNYNGGIRFHTKTESDGPFYPYFRVCNGAETSIGDCDESKRFDCYMMEAVGVVCYTSEEPKFRIESDGRTIHSGRLLLSNNGENGAICADTWSDDDADVACLSMDEMYRGGKAIELPGTGLPWVLSSFDCFGQENSLFECPSSAWNKVNETGCGPDAMAAGVICYSSVSLVKGNLTNDYYYGTLEVKRYSADTEVCFNDKFTHQHAKHICRELGYQHAAFLKPADLYDEYYTMKDIACAGEEKSISECNYILGFCAPSDGAVRLFCYKNEFSGLNRWVIKDDSHGALMTNTLSSFVGYSCRSMWTDRDADALCKQKSFKGGKLLGASKANAMKGSKEIVWFGSFSCKSDITGKFCMFEDDAERDCYNGNEGDAAAVLCYKDEGGIKLRLMDHDKEAKFAGRVEISYGGVWGTVCNNKNGSRLQARTLCKGMGFTDGAILDTVTTKRFGVGSGPIYLKDVSCSASDDYFIGCPSAEGWNSATNCRHADDLEVICYSDVRLFPDAEKSYGTIGQMINGAYSLICSDGFTDVEAGVACRYLGYTTGKAVCCSTRQATGYLQTIGIDRVQCAGTEASLSNCSYETGSWGCRSGSPASLACSFRPQGDQFNLRVTDEENNILIIKYLDAEGNVCPEHFDHSDARVTCKELGFSGGFAVDADSYTKKPLVWPFKADCVGSETSLSACPGLEIMARIGPCPVDEVAAVYCLKQSSGLSGGVRLRGSTEKNKGRLEIQIDGVWGSVSPWRFEEVSDTVANVACRQLGFSGGQSLPPGTFGKGPERIWFSGISCSGSEKNILDCKLKNLTSVVSPLMGFDYDVSVDCYRGVKLVHNPDALPNSGQLAVKEMNSTTWDYVCDTGISDVEATVACRGLGYTYGKRQCCNPAGMDAQIVVISSIKCSGNEESLLKCAINRDGVCDSPAAFIHCSYTEFDTPGFGIAPMFDFIGMPEAKLYDLTGGICASGFGDEEAAVICKQLGFTTGIALRAKKRKPGDLILVSSLNCTGKEKRVRDCGYHSVDFEAGCSDRYAAQILCKSTFEPIQYRTKPSSSRYPDRAEIVIDGKEYLLSIFNMNTYAATVFCNSMPNSSYAYGELISRRIPGVLDERALMTSVNCGHDAKTFLDCKAVYLPKYQSVSASDIAYIKCHKGVELSSGGQTNSGILTLFNKKVESYGSVCTPGFGQTETDVACTMLNYDFGIQHCCNSFGFNNEQARFKSVKCDGSETSLFDCDMTSAITPDDYVCNKQDYVELSCFNGTRSKDFKVKLWGTESSSVGRVEIDYMGVPGSICTDDWDDEDATVVCKGLGYPSGQAYFHFKPLFMLSSSVGPYWLTNVGCTGNESRLADCPNLNIGDVKRCKHGHHAGVLCTRGNEFTFRIAGTNQPHFGRVEVKINDEWGTVCSRYWDQNEANVMCRQMGYNSGVVFDTTELAIGTGPVYELSPRCGGDETRLNDCPHEGWISGQTGSCANHMRDAGVFCYSSVRLGTGSGQSFNHGPVLLYDDKKWYRVCDDGFNDLTARKVCQELGYYTGKKICCSAYEGESNGDNRGIHPNTTLNCVNKEQTLEQCRAKNGVCKSNYYASVICFHESDDFDDEEYAVTIQEDFQHAGKLEVTHYGVKGRVCSSNWTDVDATVVCKERGMSKGLAYFHSFKRDYVAASEIGPFWMSNVSCVGNETKLSDCKFNTREDLGNCSEEHTAAVVCYNDNGIQYRLSGTGSKPNSGRVEMSIDNRWGTVCNELWDNNDAKVVCRERGYGDGQIEKNSQFGPGTGPVWLRNVQCVGNEAALHKCPHTGFQDEEGDDSIINLFVNPCSTHKKDAAVFCFDDAKLNQPLGHPSGGLYFYNQDKWEPVCADSFSRQDAQIACKDLMQGYEDGLAIDGGRFGLMKGNITINSLSCTGSEESLSKCPKSAEGTCRSGDYASVACYTSVLTDDDFKFQVRLASDSIRTSDEHGILEIRQNGVWGRVCMHEFTDKEATVACKQLGFTGGNVYLHLFRNLMPIIWSKTTCRGTESSLENCDVSREVDPERCDFSDEEAGLLCYNKKGVEYRLSQQSKGRVEIGIEGDFGTVCQINWSKTNSKVLCRHLGYKDGMPIYERDNTLPAMPTLISFFLCKGPEKSLLTCLNSGFDRGENSVICGGEAYTACYNEEIKITKTRLQEGKTAAEGRVEVYVEPTGEWGTICDDGWSNTNARVVCRELGYDDGVALDSGDEVMPGEGNIFLDNVDCNGTESELRTCKHNGVNFHNCDHFEDAGVRCFNVTAPPPTTSSPKTTTTAHKTTATTKLPVSSTKLTTSSVKPVTTKPPSSSTSTTTTTPTATTPTTTPTTKPSTPTPTTTTTNPSTTTLPGGGTPDTQRSSGDKDENKIIIASSVSVVILAIIAILVVVFVIYRYRIKPKSSFNHERFHNESVEHSNDGSVAISNRLYGVENPEGEDPISNYMADGSEIHLDNGGYASFSKGSSPVSNGDTIPDGFDNPLYAVKNPGEANPDDVIVGVNNKGDETQYESTT